MVDQSGVYRDELGKLLLGSRNLDLRRGLYRHPYAIKGCRGGAVLCLLSALSKLLAYPNRFVLRSLPLNSVKIALKSHQKNFEITLN